MATVPHVPVPSALSGSHLRTAAGAVPVFWDKGDGPVVHHGPRLASPSSASSFSPPSFCSLSPPSFLSPGFFRLPHPSPLPFTSLSTSLRGPVPQGGAEGGGAQLREPSRIAAGVRRGVCRPRRGRHLRDDHTPEAVAWEENYNPGRDQLCEVQPRAVATAPKWHLRNKMPPALTKVTGGGEKATWSPH